MTNNYPYIKYDFNTIELNLNHILEQHVPAATRQSMLEMRRNVVMAVKYNVCTPVKLKIIKEINEDTK